jgi:hypothetical protein
MMTTGLALLFGAAVAAGKRSGSGVGVVAGRVLGGAAARNATDEQSKSTPKRRRNGNPFNA